MKRRFLIVGTAVTALVIGATIAWAATGPPEIDRVDGGFQLTGTAKMKTCAGEDAPDVYKTYSGSVSGAEVDTSPPPGNSDPAHDHTLAGKLTLSKIKIAINVGAPAGGTPTYRGWLTATATLTNTAGMKLYSGKLTLILQGNADAGQTGVYDARGFLTANTFLPPGTADKEFILTNVEARVDLHALAAVTINGTFGDSNMGNLDWSVDTDLLTCP